MIALHLRSLLLPVVVLALILATLVIGLGRYNSGTHIRPFPVAYGSTSGSNVSSAGVATSVNGQANLAG